MMIKANPASHTIFSLVEVSTAGNEATHKRRFTVVVTEGKLYNNCV